MARTAAERSMFDTIRVRLENLRAALLENPCPSTDASPNEWLSYLAVLKETSGNASNDMSFVATVLAKEYLEQRLPMQPFDAATKPQGAPGLDIDERTVDGERVVAEIKTTTPYKGPKGLGAQQIASFMNDFAKLAKASAEHRFFFVTDPLTFEVVRERYGLRLQGVTVVLLGTAEEFTAT